HCFQCASHCLTLKNVVPMTNAATPAATRPSGEVRNSFKLSMVETPVRVVSGKEMCCRARLHLRRIRRDKHQVTPFGLGLPLRDSKLPSCPFMLNSRCRTEFVCKAEQAAKCGDQRERDEVVSLVNRILFTEYGWNLFLRWWLIPVRDRVQWEAAAV